METVRLIERTAQAAPQARYERSAFDLDLSAFEPTRADVAIAQETRRPGAAAIMQPRKVIQASTRRDDGVSRRSVELQAERAQERNGRALSRPKQALRPTQLESARTDHLHESSPKARKERSRENCKERPEPANKKSGRGSRGFVHGACVGVSRNAVGV